MGIPIPNPVIYRGLGGITEQINSQWNRCEVKCIYWQKQNKIVENQNVEVKTTFEKKNSYFVIFKMLYFISISVKCTSCIIKGFQKKCDRHTIHTKRFIEELTYTVYNV